MNRKKILTLLLLTSLALVSCEKVIDLDLNDGEKRYVVEANLSDKPGSAIVKLTQTKSFNEDNVFPGISNATVTISEQGGPSYTLTESSQGVYTHAGLQVVAGNTYQLNVQINGETFSATCTAPPPVEIDTLFVTDELLFGETRKIANIGFRDPDGRGNNYRFIQYINGRKEKQILVINDDYIDGRLFITQLFYFADEDEGGILIKSGDELKVELQMIDPAMYLYWFSLLRSSTGGNQQATPSNPVSNISGGALGYFSAHTERSRTIVVP